MLVAINLPPVTAQTKRHRPTPSHPGKPNTARQAPRRAASASRWTSGIGVMRAPAEFGGQGGEGHRQLRRPGTEPPQPTPGRRVGNLHIRRRRPDPNRALDHRLEHSADCLNHVQATHEHEGREQGMGGPTAVAPDPRHPHRAAPPALADLALIARPERQLFQARRTVRSWELERAASGHVLLDGQRTGPYDGHRWQHRLGPPSAAVPTGEEGGPSRNRDHTSSSPQLPGCPIASQNSVAETGGYVTR